MMSLPTILQRHLLIMRQAAALARGVRPVT